MKFRYKILSPLGEGGMGHVSLAEDLETGQRVALKFLSRGLDPQARSFFKQEVKLLARLSHPNLIRIFDYYEGDEPFFAMEYVDGVLLTEAVKEASTDRILDLFVQTCRGLHFIHSRNILHRDLKPTNIMATRSGIVKILDFGIARVGTPAYMAPEALMGSYDPRCDLFSLGVTWNEILGRRSLPHYFQEVLERLRSPDPNRRPASALSLIKYLNRHVPRPFEIEVDEERALILDKPPWIERAEEKAFWKAVQDVLQGSEPRFLKLDGPTGVGRTRFLEEMKWKFQLKGVSSCVTIHARLHELEENELQKKELSLRAAARASGAHLTILEYNNELVSPCLQKLLAYVDSLPGVFALVLKDLSPAQTRDLIRQATSDLAKPLDKNDVDAIAEGSGGRPLLVIEGLRNLLMEGEKRAMPRNLQEACAAQVGALPPAAQELLATIVSDPGAVSFSEVSGLWDDAKGSFDDAWEVLQTRGLLSHPTLKELYRNALSVEQARTAHQRWLTHLLKNNANGPAEGPAALAIVHHAMAVDRMDAAQSWGIAAVETLVKKGDLNGAIELSQRLLAGTKDAVQRYTLFAHQAPIYYRLGRYEDALKAYDEWFALKPDDGTKVETIKHSLYTGFVFQAWGRLADARACFDLCLQTGNDERHPHHRPYHARALSRLAALDERERKMVEARGRLNAALKLAQGNALLLGEIEHQQGKLAETANAAEQALKCFRRSAAHYAEARQPQAEATSLNSIFLILRREGRIGEAFIEIERALRLAEQGGEILQMARYRENRALVLMDQGGYGEAVAEMEKTRDVLEQFGDDLDRPLILQHRQELETLLGRSEPRRLEALKAALHDRFSKGVEKRPLEEAIEAIKSVESPEARSDLYRRIADDLGKAGLDRLALALRNAAYLELQNIYQSLPEELKMDFEKRPDLKKLNESLGDLLPRSQGTQTAAAPGAIAPARFRQFCAINRQIALKSDMGEILDRVLDAAIEITGAERGFVLIKDGKSGKSPIPGYEIKAARNLNRESLHQNDFELSLSMVKQAIEKSTYVLTDDAYTDPRFHEKKSVMDYRLRSILAVPLEEEGKVFGAIYLDDRYQPNCFSEEDLTLVNALAAQASLAIQKARLIEELRKSHDRLEAEVEVLSEELEKKRGDLRYGYEEIIGQAPAMIKVFQILDDVTDTTIPVWIHGESGTGKELIARSLHYNSPRAKGPFVAENVSAIPETLLESELFGHKKGAFTHADRDRVGLFEQASGGTLFLDEIADMSLPMQAKLLRVLQEGEVRPVGSGKKVKIDVRLVTASNRDLGRMVSEGKFRQDLYFRINGLTIDLPPLRHRKEDLPLLVRHFVKKIAKEFNLPASEPTDKALKSLMTHHWPGNVRELESVLRNALLFAKGRPIGPDHLMIKSSSMGVVMAAPSPSADQAESKEDAAHRSLVVSTLQKHHLNKESAAKELGVSLRTLYTWMEKHGIPKKKALLSKYAGVS